MGLFQRSVLNKFLKQQDKDAVAKAYKKFSKHFHNAQIQTNIRNSKEEQYQEGFLRELFVDVFGYTLNPQPKYNLTTELKNEKGAKKADGAILKDGGALGVIELKGTDTKDLEKVRQQAFDYKANQTGCVYVITSNFEKLRFYINNAVEWEEFDLFTINEQRFELLYLCLAADNLLNNVPLKIKEASIVEEESITKKFYADYSLFKRELYRDLVKENMRNEVFRSVLAGEESVSRADKNIKLTLFKKSQKLIDRFLFIFFAEDRGLLPPNSTLQILEQFDKLKEMDAHVPLYNRFKLYFSYLDQGRKGTVENAEIFAYNGGLFKPDPILDSLLIDDELLYKHAKTLAKYDFESQVDVNILGHIFENSLNEIESVNAEIEGVDFDKQKTKRKKDGVFYTPKYITKYIVDNTVGKLCTEKKAELGIIDEEFTSNKHKDTKRKLLDKLENYRAWLLEITICDPACGSGAFLNQALDFLINEHRAIDELQASLLGGGLVFPDIENTILEQNIYGVDLNEESVEIAKLSLWLRTAQPRRKLNDLNNNIKCGNSLIDNKAVAGDKAFSWEKEFPEVFAKGGFDVVIGNPPYVRQELMKEYSETLKKYEVYSGKGDLYTYFYELGFKILRANGVLSFISSGKFFEASYGVSLCSFLTKNFKIVEVINFDDLEVFEGISAYPLIFTGIKTAVPDDYEFDYCFVPDHVTSSISEVVANFPFSSIHKIDFINNEYKFFSRTETRLLNKLNHDSIYLKDLNCLPLVGVKTGFNEGFMVDTEERIGKPYVFGKNLKRYLTPISETNIIFPYKRKDGQYILSNEDELGRSKELLLPNRNQLEKRAIIKDGIVNGTKVWYEYQQINKKLDFDSEYIVYPNVSLGANFTLSSGNVIDMTGFIIPSSDKYLLALLNSRISQFVMRKTAITRRGGYQEYKVQYLENIPLKSGKPEVKLEITQKVDIIIELVNLENKKRLSLYNYIVTQVKDDNLPRKLLFWQNLEIDEVLVELNKAIKKAGGEKLSKADEMEWMGLFETKKKEAQDLKAEIERTEKEIDQMVYELYGLSEEEIRIVEEASN